MKTPDATPKNYIGTLQLHMVPREKGVIQMPPRLVGAPRLPPQLLLEDPTNTQKRTKGRGHKVRVLLETHSLENQRNDRHKARHETEHARLERPTTKRT